MFARLERIIYIGGLVWNVGVLFVLVWLAFFRPEIVRQYDKSVDEGPA